MKTLSTLTIALAILLAGCKGFIEPSIEKKNVVLLAPANRAESSQFTDFHKSLSASPFYPAKMIHLIRVGEEVNKMDYFFEKIAAQYTEEVEYISSLLEPLIFRLVGWG